MGDSTSPIPCMAIFNEESHTQLTHPPDVPAATRKPTGNLEQERNPRAMSLHYLNPDDEPRDCPPCKGTGRRRPRKGRGARICNECKGTGRLGREGAEPDVAITGVNGWYSWHVPPTGEPQGAYPCRSDALAAAREAHGREVK